MSNLCCHLIRKPHVAGLVEPDSSGANGADGPEFLKKFSKPGRD